MPEFGKKFGDVSATVGESVKVAVQFSGKPKRIQWFHRGMEIESGPRYQVSVSIHWQQIAGECKRRLTAVVR